MKKITLVPSGVNTINNKRKLFLKKLLKYTSEDKTGFYQNEANINIFCRRNEGLSLRGERCRILLPNSKGSNVSCIALYSNQRINYFEIREGCNKNDDDSRFTIFRI